MSMKADSFSLSWISDPQVFAVNRLDAVSDHDVYASAQEAEQGVSSLKRSLRGQAQGGLHLQPGGVLAGRL